MTWIKASFGWMMHRSSWAGKPGQERVLANEITRGGFEWALAHACLSRYKPGTHDSPQAWAAMRDASPVRVQWDPDRSLTGERLERRAIQVGLSGEAVHRYCDEWIRSIADITATVREGGQLIRADQIADVSRDLPAEKAYRSAWRWPGGSAPTPATWRQVMQSAVHGDDAARALPRLPARRCGR